MGWIRKWLDLSLGTKCLLLISVPAAATVAMAGASYLAGAQSAAASQQLRASFRIGGEIGRLRASEIETSTQARAYLMAPDEALAGKTREALAAFDSAWQNLSDLTTQDAFQRERLGEIAVLERSRVERIFEDMARVRSHTSPSQLGGPVQVAEAERLALERILQSMEAANARAVDQYLPGARALRTRETASLAIGLFLGVVVSAALALRFAQGLTNRIGKLQRNIAQLEAGIRIDGLPGRDEIGILSEGLVQIARLFARQRAALEGALHGIAEVDCGGRYRWLNKAYAKIAGLSEGYRPPTIQATVPAEDRPRLQEAMRIMHLRGRAELATRIESISGPTAEVELTFFESGPPEDGFHVFLREIGSARAADRALIRAKDAAVASNRAKTDFLAKISHDIRTPLSAILGAVDLLSQTALTFDQSGYVHMFQRNCRRLVALINDFLDFAQIEAGAIHVEKAPFQVREIVDDAVATFREAAARKSIVLAVDIDPQAPEWLIGDSLRIQQVLVNLLSNALKFTAAGRVDVRVKVLDGAGSSAGSNAQRLHCEVVDTGPGIAPEEQETIFLKFIQLPNQASGQRGAGLGLTICRDLVELMGGEIGVSTPAGGGSNFHFILPLETAPPGARTVPEASAAPAPGKLPAPSDAVRILVAEDTEDSRLLVEHYLRSEKVDLRFAFTGREALDAVQRGEKFDLILMDIDMPVLNGYEATKAIRAWETSRGLSTPIVALTADAMSEAVRSSLEAGCVAHVAKPLDRGVLLNTIQRYASVKSALSIQADKTPAVSERVLELVPQYLGAKRKQIEEARASLISRDFAPIRRFGHNLKGTGRGYGFPAIEAMGREIESAAVEANVDRIAHQLDALLRFVNHAALANAGS